MSASLQDQHPPSRVVERYIAIPGPKNYLRSKQQAAFFGVIMVAYLTIATLIPQDCIQLSDYHSFAIEEEEDWEDIQDEEAPLTPVQSWGEYTRMFYHVHYIAWFHASIPGLSATATKALSTLNNLIHSLEFREFGNLDITPHAYLHRFQYNKLCTKEYQGTLGSEFEEMYVWRSRGDEIKLKDIRVAQLWHDINLIRDLPHKASDFGMHSLVLELLEWSRSACPEMLWPLTTMLTRLNPGRNLVTFADEVKAQEDTDEIKAQGNTDEEWKEDAEEEESEQDKEKGYEGDSDESDFVLV